MAKFWRSSITSGTWTTASNWSDTSITGAAATVAPSATDDVTIPPGITVNVTSTSTCRNLTVTAGTAVTLGGTSTLTVTGNITLQSNTNVSLSGTIVVSSGTTHTINTAGVTMQCALTLGATGTTGETFTLASNVIIVPAKTLTHTAGALSLNGYNITCGIWSSSNSNTRSIAFGTATSAIYITSITTSTVLTYATGTGFSYTGTSKFVLSGDVVLNSVITRTITTTGLTSTTAINIFVQNGASVPLSSPNTDIIAVTSAAVILSLDLTAYSGKFLCSSRTINIYGYIDFGNSVTSSGTLSTSFSWTLNSSGLSPSGILNINFSSVNIGGLTLNSGTYTLIRPLTLSSVLTISGGTFYLGTDLYCSAATQNGGTLKITDVSVLRVTGTFTANGGTLDLSDPTTHIDSTCITCDAFAVPSTSYNMISNRYGSAYTYWWPQQIEVTGTGTLVNITGVGPNITGGDIGFNYTYSGSSSTNSTMLDTSGKFFYKFSLSSVGKIIFGTVALKGLDLSAASASVGYSSTSQITIYGDFLANNTFSAGSTSANIFLYGSGTSTNPNTFEVFATTNINYTMYTGYYTARGDIDTSGNFTINSGATFNTYNTYTSIGSSMDIYLNTFVCSGTLRHNTNLSVYFKSMPAAGTPCLNITGPTINNSTVGPDYGSGRVCPFYTGTSTTNPRTFSITSIPASAKDALNLQDYSYYVGSLDRITVTGYFRDINTIPNNGTVFFNDAKIYGDISNTNSTTGSITLLGNIDATVISTGFQDLTSFKINKTTGYKVLLDTSFDNTGAAYTIDVVSGTLKFGGATISSFIARTGSTVDLGTGTVNILSAFTYETGVTVIPNTGTIACTNTTITGAGCSLNNITVSGQLTLSGNNTINSISLSTNGVARLSSSNTIGSISNTGYGGTLYLYDNTTTIVTDFLLTGLNSSSRVYVTRVGTTGTKPILKKSSGITTAWNLGTNSILTTVTGATAQTGMNIDYLTISGIDFKLFLSTAKFLMFF